MRRRVALLSIIWLYALLPLSGEEFEVSAEPSPPVYEFEEERFPVIITGFLRTMARGTKNPLPDKSHDIFLLSAHRLRLAGAWEYGNFKGEVARDFEMAYANDTSSALFDLYAVGGARNRLSPLEFEYRDTGATYRARLHRGWAKYDNGKWYVSVGCQAIGWGEGRFLNPLDLITPIDPLTLDFEDISGADSLHAGYFFNGFNSLSLVVAPYRRANSLDYTRLQIEDTNALLRFKGTAGDTDYSLSTGRHFHSTVFGADIIHSWLDAAWRFGTLLRRDDIIQPGREEVTIQTIAGASYTFSKGWRASLEYFYNGNTCDTLCQSDLTAAALHDAQLLKPDSDDSSFFRTAGRRLTRNPHLAQSALGKQITPRFSADLAVFWDLAHSSSLMFVNLGYILSDQGQFVLGGWFFPASGSAGREFSGEAQVFSFLRWHF